MTSTSGPQPRSRRNRWIQFVLVVVGLAAVWLVVLPRIAARPAMSAHLRWLDDQGIDPSAMFYTELEMMDQILEP